MLVVVFVVSVSHSLFRELQWLQDVTSLVRMFIESSVMYNFSFAVANVFIILPCTELTQHLVCHPEETAEIEGV
jgi:hypothetical protein